MGERAMAFNVRQLVAAGVELPANLHIVDQCKEHRGCFVYRFGTRRLHVTTQAVDDGRLLLVVRCGGGFADFYEFATRHAPSENVKLQRKLATQSQVLRLSRAFSKSGLSIGNRNRCSSPAVNATVASTQDNCNRNSCSSPAVNATVLSAQDIGNRSRCSTPVGNATVASAQDSGNRSRCSTPAGNATV